MENYPMIVNVPKKILSVIIWILLKWITNMIDKRGYIAIWRKIQDHPFYKEKRIFSKYEAWIDILMEAQHNKEPQEVCLGMNVLECQYAECLKSVRTWGKRWGWSEAKVYRFLKLLKKMEQITTKNETVTTRIKVLNYKQYDPSRNTNVTQAKQLRNSCETQAKTDNNVKNEKNVKKEKIVLPDWLDLKIWAEYKKYRQNGKAKFTLHAQRLAIGTLKRLKKEGNNPSDVINQTIERGWSGLFPVKDSYQSKTETKTSRHITAENVEDLLANP